MKPFLLLPVAACALLLAGCEGIPTPDILSLDSAIAEQDVPPGIPFAGAWESANSDQVCLIHKEKDGAFSVAYLSGESVSLKARLFRAGSADMVELRPEKGQYFSVPAYSYARIWIVGNTLRWTFLDSDWAKEQLGSLPRHADDGQTLLLAPGPAVRALLEKLAADERAYSTVVEWQRMQ
jgi:hypothetical protein